MLGPKLSLCAHDVPDSPLPFASPAQDCHGNSSEIGESLAQVDSSLNENEELDPANEKEKDPRVIQFKLLERERSNVLKKKEAELLSPLIEEKAISKKIKNPIPQAIDFLEMIIAKSECKEAKKGNLPSATKEDLIQLKIFLTRVTQKRTGTAI